MGKTRYIPVNTLILWDFCRSFAGNSDSDPMQTLLIWTPCLPRSVVKVKLLSVALFNLGKRVKIRDKSSLLIG